MSTPSVSVAAPAVAGPSAPLVVSMAAGAGFAVASLYYSQPMLGLIAQDLGAGERGAGLVPTLTQLGYALGILLLAPLGDRFDRRVLILGKSVLLALALAAAAMAAQLPGLLAASLVIGLVATLAQDIVPAAATLAPEARRGQVVGRVMTGLLLGILLSRVVSGLVAQAWGWRTLFVLAAVAVALMGLVLARALPRFAPTTTLRYPALLGSLWALWRQQPQLRRAVASQSLLAVGFSAFWSTLALMLHARLGLGSAAAGAFGIAGAAGALAAPVAGRYADRLGSHAVARLAIGVALIGFALLLTDAWLPMVALLPVLVVSTVLFDFGFQSALIAHQTLVYGLVPPARSRLNALLFTGMFVGMASGGALGSLALAQWGWMGVASLATLCAGGSLLLRLR
ncbi:MFS transporter [Stenotrophomonas sp. 24(2023)]|uniref:MFS transporter n=1 Tax=Stenotrophomonas sp. 24(2023) TaxID=3068324 RepID=UPI0027E10B3D|nr:MFS transporter [Stenotrophomonas sp. 24(2023)]WMJ69502.1 MFS transporter [Stenotrophomonas sp. 24(2023)]